MQHILVHKIAGDIYVPRAAIWTSPSTHLEPDLFYVSEELESRMNPEMRNSADLVVEVMSPSSEVYDRRTKADTYLALAVRELWLISQKDQTIEVRPQQSGRIFKRGEILQSSVFPELSASADSIFS